MDEKPKRVNWRNVACLVLLGSPLLYYASDILPRPDGAPTITSPEGRAIVRNYLRTFFPQLVANKGTKGVSR